MPIADGAEVKRNVESLLDQIRLATSEALAAIAGRQRPRDEGERRRAEQATRWLAQDGPATAAAVLQSLVRFGTSFTAATEASRMRSARRREEAGASYLALVLSRQAEQASTERTRVAELQALFHSYDGELRNAHGRIESCLRFLDGFWRQEETRFCELAAKASRGMPPELEVVHARRSWRGLADFARNAQEGTSARSP